MLLYVLESKGSSPGRQGFFMAVNASGEMSGSLGGGIMEHKFVELAKSILKEGMAEASIHYQFHDKEAAKNQSGMICSGEQTIFVYKVKPAEVNILGALIRSMKENKNGTLQLSPEGIIFNDTIPDIDFMFEKQTGDNFIYQEKTGYKHHLFVIGGGHCSLSFCRLMSGMDFYISLLDDREELNTINQNLYVHEKTIVSHYSLLKDIIPAANNVYVVIMTMGYRSDETALKALLGKSFKYLGILGSKTKISKMFANLQIEGIAHEILDNIHAPVGIPIHSQSPEEIAISIAAEIIKIKNTMTE